MTKRTELKKQKILKLTNNAYFSGSMNTSNAPNEAACNPPARHLLAFSACELMIPATTTFSAVFCFNFRSWSSSESLRIPLVSDYSPMMSFEKSRMLSAAQIALPRLRKLFFPFSIVQTVAFIALLVTRLCCLFFSCQRYKKYSTRCQICKWLLEF